eukprot:2656907-Pleurochrysis_carterae.AAC.1
MGRRNVGQAHRMFTRAQDGRSAVGRGGGAEMAGHRERRARGRGNNRCVFTSSATLQQPLVDRVVEQVVRFAAAVRTVVI